VLFVSETAERPGQMERANLTRGRQGNNNALKQKIEKWERK